MSRATSSRIGRPSEDGYMLITVIFLLFVFALALSIAAPMVAKSIQRDREVETMHRGLQYRRAIQLYFKKFQSYPPNIDALVKTNNIRFLRKRYVDPMTGKDDWKPIMFGQAKQPMAMGFFGQPLAGGATAIAGIGPSGGSTTGSGFGSTTGTPSGGTFGGSTGSGIGGSSGGILGGSSGLFGSNQPGNTGLGGTTTGGTTTSGSTTGATTDPSQNGSNASGATGSTTGANGTSGSTSATVSTSSTGSTTGQTFGGAGIVGFEPGSTKQSILLYKKKNHFNEWEFTYTPQGDPSLGQIGGNTGTVGAPASSLSGQSGTTGTGTTSGIGSGSSSTGIGGTGSGSTFGSGTSSTTTSPTTNSPAQPQQ